MGVGIGQSDHICQRGDVALDADPIQEAGSRTPGCAVSRGIKHIPAAPVTRRVSRRGEPWALGIHGQADRTDSAPIVDSGGDESGEFARSLRFGGASDPGRGPKMTRVVAIVAVRLGLQIRCGGHRSGFRSEVLNECFLNVAHIPATTSLARADRIDKSADVSPMPIAAQW